MSSSVPPGAAAAELRSFLELVNLYDQRGEANMRDRFLILAADAAYSAGQPQEAERLLQRLVQVSPHHMLKAYRSFADALKAEPVRNYISDLKQNYPPEMVQGLLESLRNRPAPPTASPGMTIPGANAPASPDPSDQTAVLAPFPAPAPSGARRPAGPPAPAPTQPAKSAAKPPAARPAPSGLPPAPAAAKLKLPPRPAAPVAPVVSAPAQPTAPSAEGEQPASSWLATLLFVLVVLAGVALAGYSLARPFLPASWGGR